MSTPVLNSIANTIAAKISSGNIVFIFSPLLVESVRSRSAVTSIVFESYPLSNSWVPTPYI